MFIIFFSSHRMNNLCRMIHFFYVGSYCQSLSNCKVESKEIYRVTMTSKQQYQPHLFCGLSYKLLWKVCTVHQMFVAGFGQLNNELFPKIWDIHIYFSNICDLPGKNTFCSWCNFTSSSGIGTPSSFHTIQTCPFSTNFGWPRCFFE